MGYILRHSEDWTSYGTDIDAVSNSDFAYPAAGYGRYWGPFDGYGSALDLDAVTVGPTLGPDGGPGIQCLTAGSPPHTTGGLIAVNLAMTCRDFKVEVLHDDTSTAVAGPVMKGYYVYPYGPGSSEFSDFLFSINRSLAGALQVIVNTTGNPLTTYNTGFMAGLVPTSGNVQWRVEGRIGTISGTPGSFSEAADGFLKIYLNDSLVHDTGLLAMGHHDATIPSSNPGGNWSPYFNSIELGLNGRVGLWRVWASDDCVSGSSRNLLTGQGHTVQGNDNLIVGRTGTVDAADMVALFSLDEAEHTVSTSKTFEVHADFINLNGTTVIGGGTAITDISAALDALGT